MRLKLDLLLPAAALFAASLFSSSAFASPINGSFSLTGLSGTYVYVSGVDPALFATGLDFGTGGSAGNGYGVNGTASVAAASGSFASLNGTTASISDIALGAAANPYTANPFLSFGTNSSIVVNFANAAIFRTPTGDVINGIASFSDGIAADATSGTFSLSTSSQNGRIADTQFTFTSNVAAPPAVTPEPSSLVLLGTGLIGAATTALRRRKVTA